MKRENSDKKALQFKKEKKHLIYRMYLFVIELNCHSFKKSIFIFVSRQTKEEEKSISLLDLIDFTSSYRNILNKSNNLSFLNFFYLFQFLKNFFLV